MEFYIKLKDIYKELYSYEGELDMIHTLLETNKITEERKKFYNTIPLFGKTDRKSCFVKDFYYYYDKDNILSNIYYNYINKHIKPLFTETKLVIQKTPNLRVHIPNNSNIGKRETDVDDEIIGLHNDSEFGHPEEEINFVLAITDMFDSNSIYYEAVPNSNMNPKHYKNIKLNKYELWCGHLNKCNHYNKINKTNKTRISIDFRVIPFSKFKKSNALSATNNQKFSIGDYYIVI
jgi:hypothetical protein